MSFPFLPTSEIPGDRSRNRMLALFKQVHFEDRKVIIRLMGSPLTDKRAHPDCTTDRLSKSAESSPSSTASVAVDLPREADLRAMDGNDSELLHPSAGLEKPAWNHKSMSRGANPFKYMQGEQT